ncbi:MAG: indole-3-glycerol phosphate synthase TrpC [Thermodesulfobacteriota bacterium]
MILDEIVRDKKIEVEGLKKYYPLKKIEDKIARGKTTADFLEAVAFKGGPDAIRIIAEVKRASPSKGIICQNFMPCEIARQYETTKAAAVSVITESKYFKGDLEYLVAITRNLKIPVLRKDFIFDEYQVYESRGAGADAILLIAAILEPALLKGLIELADSMGMDSLVEVHDEAEIEKALGAGARIIGINNRDLQTFEVDMETTVRLAPKIPGGCAIVSESGISSHADILHLKEAGASAFLIGEAILRERDMRAKLRELRGTG